MVDLTKRPFYLNEEQVKWVEDTYASMSYDEKVGQLFINLTLRFFAGCCLVCNRFSYRSWWFRRENPGGEQTARSQTKHKHGNQRDQPRFFTLFSGIRRFCLWLCFFRRNRFRRLRSRRLNGRRYRRLNRG